MLIYIEMLSKMQSETGIIASSSWVMLTKGLMCCRHKVKCHLWISSFNCYYNSMGLEDHFPHFRDDKGSLQRTGKLRGGWKGSPGHRQQKRV